MSSLLTHKVLEYEIDISDLSLDEIREVRSDIKLRIKNIDIKADEMGISYKELGRLGDQRYRLSRMLGDLEDAIIKRRRNSMNLSSVAYQGGGIYTDASDKKLSKSCGRNAKLQLRGISI